jgi:Protein of unknown function (DUF1084)
VGSATCQQGLVAPGAMHLCMCEVAVCLPVYRFVVTAQDSRACLVGEEGLNRHARLRPVPSAGFFLGFALVTNCARGIGGTGGGADCGHAPCAARQVGLWAFASQADGEHEELARVLSCTFLAAVSVAAATGFLVYGGRLFLMLRRFPIESRGRTKKLREASHRAQALGQMRMAFV